MHASLPGVNLHYVEQGPADGLPVVFLHGFPFSHEMWKPQLEAVGRSYRAIAYDIRGHGMSDVGDGQYTIEGHADDLFGFLDHMKIPRAVVVGLSMGGYITLRALQRDQTRFVAAALCDTKSEADTDEGKLKRFEAVKAVKQHGSAQFAENFARAVFDPASFERIPASVQEIKRIISHLPPLSIAGTLLALASRTDTSGFLPSITVPVLILVGENDVTTPVSSSRLMHERITGSEMHIIPRAAHMSNLENPEAFNEKLLGFLGRLGR